MKYSLIDKVSKKFLVWGEDVPGSKVRRLIDQGHTKLEVEPPPPGIYFWDGTKWVEDATTKALNEWRAKLRQLDLELLGDARFWEELVEGNVSQIARDRMNALIALRKKTRTEKPV